MVHKIAVHYFVKNCSDGSAYVIFGRTRSEVDKLEEEEMENGYGWGESSSGTETMYVLDDGTVVSEKRPYDFENLEELKDYYKLIDRSPVAAVKSWLDYQEHIKELRLAWKENV